MDNKIIAQHFALLADLMELHNENPFKIKSYEFAGRSLKNIEPNLTDLSIEEIEQIQGIGKAIATKIFQLCRTNKLELLEEYISKTPLGIIELLKLKGIGPKKIGQLWRELEIESLGELEYACNENRLITLKGFGTKTQENILQQITFIHQNANKFLWCNVEDIATEVIAEIQQKYPTILVSACGEFRRKSLVISQIDILIAEQNQDIQNLIVQDFNHYPICFHFCSSSTFYLKLLELSSSAEHFGFLSFKINSSKNYTSEKEIYEDANLPFIVPEIRDSIFEFKLIEQQKLAHLIELKDIKGVVHAHSTYSDGATSLKKLATHCKDNGFEYLVISDHSKSAFYANGMTVEKILQQHEEIEILNKELFPFKIFKSVESDILYDGNLDYDAAVLQKFDLVIASIHSQLKMSEEKATERLIKAIENPYTTILGHPTGRLLLAREGYPIQHKKIIDACATNNVCIELNANPRRLDVDYKWIQYCQEKNVKISINPDAHNLQGVQDIRYGIYAARKGGLLKENTLNSFSKDDFEAYIKKLKEQ